MYNKAIRTKSRVWMDILDDADPSSFSMRAVIPEHADPVD
jgi:hypothetical protein